MDNIDNYLAFAKEEIQRTYGHNVVLGRKSLHKFGRFENLGTAENDINYLGIDPLHSTTNSITTVSSSNASDTTQTIVIEGMTISGTDLSFTSQGVTLNGQAKVTLTTPVSRVTRISNSIGPVTTLGDVYVYEDTAISGGIPTDLSTVGNVMAVADQSTLFAGTSVSSNNYFIMTGLWAYLGKKTNAFADIRFKTKAVGTGFSRSRVIGSISNSSPLARIIQPYLIITPNTDIDITGVGSTTNIDVFAGFDGVFADIRIQ